MSGHREPGSRELISAAACRLPAFREALKGLAGDPGRVFLSGLAGSSRSLLAALLFGKIGRLSRLLLVTHGVESAAAAAGDLETFLGPEPVLYFPFQERLPGEDLPVPPEITGQRLNVLHELLEEKAPRLVVCPVQALLGPVPGPAGLRGRLARLESGASLDRRELLETLDRFGYRRVSLVLAPGEAAARGGIVDFFPVTSSWPVRVELAGPRVRSLRFFDPSSQLSREETGRVTVPPLAESDRPGDPGGTLADYLAPASGTVVALAEPSLVAAEAGRFLSLGRGDRPGPQTGLERLAGLRTVSLAELPPDPGPFPGPPGFFRPGPVISFPAGTVSGWSLKAAPDRERWSSGPAVVYCRNESQVSRLGEIFRELSIEPHPDTRLETGFLSGGFVLPGLAVLSDSELFGRYRTFRPRLRLFFQSPAITGLDEMKPGDHVVHINEGIGRFLGVAVIDNGGRPEEVLQIEYAEGIVLSVPVSQVNLVHRYAGSDASPPLSRLGGKAWLRTREKVRRGIRDMASDLVRIYSRRREVEGVACPGDTPWQRSFEGEFVWEETPDQLRAIGEVGEDLCRPRPMDRLLCGDVGYGKTEVAMRAAFRVAESGRQVALLCPTTILCQQHLHTFRERFADYPFVIENLSRFRAPAEQREVVGRLASGGVDIVIGTHRLLSRDIAFRDLGLWIVDEEQRFGVAHKEKLRARWPAVDILTLTATPIPRTLQLSLAGIRDLSLVETPPAGRHPVITVVAPWNDETVVNACRREIERDGQVFFVHNRILDIASVAGRLRALLPGARIETCHGRMEEEELSGVMERFLAGAIDILVSTSIIESGLDIPNANTMIVNQCHRFGLADLYQLRGRVGRFHSQAYCYLLYPGRRAVGEEGRRRLRAIEEFQSLGSGFRLAIADLEIRGAGNLLGREQHGFIETVGFYLYSHFFREEVARLSGQELPPLAPEGEVEGSLPEDYIPPPELRLSFYRRIFGLSEQSAELAREMADRFGPLPEETRRLLEILGTGG